jgi:hypothetical protein
MQKYITLIVFLIYNFITPTFANDVRTTQELLTKLDYNPGPVDGRYSVKTKLALKNFYAIRNQIFDGELSSNEIKDLKKVLTRKQINRQVNYKKVISKIAVSLNISSKPHGVLSQYNIEKLWNAYKTTGECFKHPDYGKGKGYRIKIQKAEAFSKTVWRDPFHPDSLTSGSASDRTVLPNSLTVVTLDESYGEQNSQVENAAKWFRSASSALRQGASEDTKT